LGYKTWRGGLARIRLNWVYWQWLRLGLANGACSLPSSHMDGLWDFSSTLYPFPLSLKIPANLLTLDEHINDGASDDIRGRKIADQNTGSFHKTTTLQKTCLGQNED
jgi:hypothetical protein